MDHKQQLKVDDACKNKAPEPVKLHQQPLESPLETSATDSNKEDIQKIIDNQTGTQQQQKVDFQESMEEPESNPTQTFTHSIDTDALPLQPRDSTKGNKTEQMTVLKEPIFVCKDQKESSAISAETEHFEAEAISEQRLGHNMAELMDISDGITCPTNDFTNQSGASISQQGVVEIVQGDYSIAYGNTANVSPIGDATSQLCCPPSSGGITHQEKEDKGLCDRELTPKLEESLTTTVANFGVRVEPSQSDQIRSQQTSISSHTETIPKEYLNPTHELTNKDRDAGATFQPAQTCTLPYPPEDWKYRKLLVDLNKMIDTDELDTMKDRFRGTFGKAIIEKIKKPRDLFIKMEERQFLNKNNIIYLQAILQELNRPELIKKTIDYCQYTCGVLYFQPASETPVNGYRYVTFHLHLDKEYSRHDLTELQSKVAEILCVPNQFVFIAGVEPSNSMLVTLMLPEMYVGILVEYLNERLLQDRFADLGIDSIIIDEREYEIKVVQNDDARTSDNQFVSLYHQLASRDLQLKGMETTCNRLHKEIEALMKRDADKTVKPAELADIRRDKEKVELLDKQMECKATLLEQSEEREREKKMLERFLSDFMNDLTVLLTNQKKGNQREIRMVSLKKLKDALKRSKEECEQLKDSQEAILSVIGNLNDIIEKRKSQLLWHKDQLETIYKFHSESMTSLKTKVDQLKTEIKEKALRLIETARQNPTSECLQEEFASVTGHWHGLVQQLHLKLCSFDDEQLRNLMLVSRFWEYDPFKYEKEVCVTKDDTEIRFEYIDPCV